MIGYHRQYAMNESMMEDKKLAAIRIVAKVLVDHGFGEWHMQFKKVKSYHAQVRYDKKLLTWNLESLRVSSKEEFIGITMHELAHILVGKGNGHNWKFKQKYHELTGNWDHSKSYSRLAVKKFVTECPECHNLGDCDRDDYPRYCRPCAAVNKRVQLHVIPTKLVEWK